MRRERVLQICDLRVQLLRRTVVPGPSKVLVPVLLPHKFDYLAEIYGQQKPNGITRPVSALTFAAEAFVTKEEVLMKPYPRCA